MLESLARRSVEIAYRQMVYPVITSGEAKHDREIAHDKTINLLERFIEPNQPLRKCLTRCFTFQDPILEQEIFGLKFKNPFMVAAGLDKNARVCLSLPAFGFGGEEIGSITKWKYEGNKSPLRIQLLEGDIGMVNFMGNPSEGLDEIAKRLKSKCVPRTQRDYNIFLNLGLNQRSFEKKTPIFDLTSTLNKLYDFGDGFTFAFSPNAFGALGVMLEHLDEILLRSNNIRKAHQVYKPFLLKLGADHTSAQLDRLLEIALKYVDGFVATNTTTDPGIKKTAGCEQLSGGYSGKLLRPKSSRTIRHIYKSTDGKVPIIASGGLGLSEVDLWETLTYDGASAFQFLTYFVHPETSTPNFAYNQGKMLARLLREHGFGNIADARGAYAK